MLYNVENWLILSEKKIQNFASDDTFITDNTKPDLLHRKFLKYILGVSETCPNLAVYGDTGEIPLSLKGYRLMLQYWYRISNLPEDDLVKKALHENVKLRTNWIITIEKLINKFNLSRSLETSDKFAYDAKTSIRMFYEEFWRNNVVDNGRLEFYNKCKNSFQFETYLNKLPFNKRKLVAKLRCSDHVLEIEKGRHRQIRDVFRPVQQVRSEPI